MNMDVTSLKSLDLDVSALERIISQHSILTVTDEKGIIIYVNKKFCDISKYSEDELIGQNHRILKSGEHSSDFYDTLWNTISNGKTWVGELKNRAKDNSFYWVKTTIIPIFNSKNIIQNYIALRTDITKEKEMLKNLETTENNLMSKNKDLLTSIEVKSTELLKNERLTTIGTMASRIAHDLKNPLTIIHTYSDMLTPEIISKLTPKDKEKWFRIQTSISDMNRIIEDVLDFAKTSEIKKTNYSLLRIIKLASNHVDHTYGVVMNLPENDIYLDCDPRKIEGVISNLLNNSVAAVGESGEINVDIYSDSEFVTIQIKDSGPGISDENMSKIFEPMFTTKTTGTGLGLVICKSIVEQHGGSITVTNKPTTFTVKLPR